MPLHKTTKLVTERERILEAQNVALHELVHELRSRVKDLEFELSLAHDAIGLAAKMNIK